MRRPRAITLVVLLLAVVPTASGEEFRVGPAFPLHPNVVVHASDGAIYAGVEGGIDRLDSSGGVRWSTKRAARPLLVHGGRLVAQGAPTADLQELVIVSLDARAPEEQPRTGTLRLPAGVRPLLDDTLDASFRIEAFAGPGGVVLLQWTHVHRPASGMRPQRVEERRTTGYARFDVATGTLSAVDDAEPPMARMPASVAAAAADLDRKPWRAGAFWIHVRRAEKQGKHLEVRRWNAQGAALPTHALAVDDWLVEAESRDGKHLNAVTRRAGGVPLVDEFAWTIYDLADGRRIGTFAAPRSAAPFAVLDGVVVSIGAPYARREGNQIVSHPLRVEGRTLAGTKAWSHPIHDPRYRGGMPPGMRR